MNSRRGSAKVALADGEDKTVRFRNTRATTTLAQMSRSRERSNAVNRLPRVALALGLIGLGLILVGFARIDGASAWFRSGALAWLFAYFLVLFDNLKRKLPIQARGGVVRREDGRGRYAMPFIPLVVMGVIALLVVLTT